MRGWAWLVYPLMVVVWQASKSLRPNLAIDALEVAIRHRHRRGHDLAGLVQRSERGVQCLSIRYADRLAINDVVAPVGPKGETHDDSRLTIQKSRLRQARDTSDQSRNPGRFVGAP